MRAFLPPNIEPFAEAFAGYPSSFTGVHYPTTCVHLQPLRLTHVHTSCVTNRGAGRDVFRQHWNTSNVDWRSQQGLCASAIVFVATM
eukprot:45027-Eustigmatos_ZCMA.PRE.1